MKALIADHDPSTRDQIAAVLNRQAATVNVAGDAERALAAAAAEEHDLIICTERLPGLSGLQLCQRLRSLGHHGRLLLLYSLPLTAAETKELGADLGCDAVLCRPFRLDTFEALLRTWNMSPPKTPTPSAFDFGVPVPAPPPTPAFMESPIEPPTAAVSDSLAPGAAFLPLPLPLPLPVPISPTTATAAPKAAPTSPGARLLPPAVARFGDLATTPLPRLLYELYVGVYFGVLELRRQGLERSICFWSGVPVRVDADQLQDSLGRLLRDAGRIDEVQFARAKHLAVTLGEPLGVALVKLGILSESELLDALARQTERKLVSTFAWRDGRYELRDDTSFAATTMIHEVSPLAAIWHGVHAHYELKTLMTYFIRLRDRFVVTTDLFQSQADVLAAELSVSPVGSLLDGKTTFETAIIRDPAQTLAVTQALYCLLVTDMIRPSETPGRGAPLPATPIASESSTPVDYATLVAASERIAREVMRLEAADHYAVLGLEPNANGAAITAAHAAAVARIRADGELHGLAPADLQRVRQALARLDLAYATLTDADRKHDYLRTLEMTSHAEEGRPEKATRAQEKRAATFQAEHLYQEGMKLLAATDHQGALTHLKAALELQPDEATYRVGVARAILAGPHAGIEDPERLAFGYLEEALHQDPGNFLAAMELARLCIAVGLWQDARRYVDEILTRAPDHPGALALAKDLAPHLSF